MRVERLQRLKPVCCMGTTGDARTTPCMYLARWEVDGVPYCKRHAERAALEIFRREQLEARAALAGQVLPFVPRPADPGQS